MMLHLDLATIMVQRRRSVPNARLLSRYVMSHKRMRAIARKQGATCL